MIECASLHAHVPNVLVMRCFSVVGHGVDEQRTKFGQAEVRHIRHVRVRIDLKGTKGNQNELEEEHLQNNCDEPNYQSDLRRRAWGIERILKCFLGEVVIQYLQWKNGSE